MKYNLPRIQRTLYSFLTTTYNPANKVDFGNTSLLFPKFTFEALGQFGYLGAGEDEQFRFSLSPTLSMANIKYTFVFDQTTKSVWVTTKTDGDDLVTYIYKNGKRVMGTSDVAGDPDPGTGDTNDTDPFIISMFADTDEMDLTQFSDTYYLGAITPDIPSFARLEGVGFSTHDSMVIDYFNDVPSISILWGTFTPGMFDSSDVKMSELGKYYMSVDGEGYYYGKCYIPSPLLKYKVFKGEPVFLDKSTSIFSPAEYMGEANALVLDDCITDDYCMVQMVDYEMGDGSSNPQPAPGGATVIKSGGTPLPVSVDGSVEVNGGNLASGYSPGPKKERLAKNASKTK
jgi:hypothetical protein